VRKTNSVQKWDENVASGLQLEIFSMGRAGDKSKDRQLWEASGKMLVLKAKVGKGCLWRGYLTSCVSGGKKGAV